MKDALKTWMSASNLLVLTVIPTVTFLSLSHQVIAKDYSNNYRLCYMVTSSGKTINLANICGLIRAKNEIIESPIKSIISEANIVRIPIKRRLGKTPVIEVTFNQQQTFEMILDTGANGSLITRKMAKLLKIKPSGSISAQIADGTEVKFPTGEVKSMAVGAVMAHNLQVVIAPRGNIGLLGHDFFGDYDIKLSATEVEFHRR